jgi:peptide-methionine (R)-S-oxide reductase
MASNSSPGKINKSEAAWRNALTREQFHVTREAGTERALTGSRRNEHRAGLTRCVACR